MKQLFYLPWWFIRARFFGRRAPLQTVLFISDICNLRCKHCSVYELKNPHNMTYEQVREHLQYSYDLGSRFVDFEGGEVTIWRDGDKRINDLIALAKEIGFFSCTITTNAQLPFKGCTADSIWVSLDGYGDYHEEVRGKGTFAKLEKNIAECGHKHLSVNMVVNTLNYEAVEQTIEYAKNNPAIEMISINFHTPFPGTEYLALDLEKRAEIIDKVYRQPQANRFLASLTPFLSIHRKEPAIHALLLSCFTDFFRRNVMQYNHNATIVHFTGSIAWYFQEEVKEAARTLNIQTGKFIKSPIHGLIKYHL
jgi:MoaA/NifB/PqqE/SkfB family radical SAM enzyme